MPALDDAARPAYLSSLSAAQYAACAAPPARPTQILAGPGSGKTRVLTSRAAWLILENHIMPEDIVVITFTNKAAAEMRHRLQALVGAEKCNRLVLGTFHATMVRYLRRFGKLINLPGNFSVVPLDDCKKLLKKILKNEFNDAPRGIKLKPEQCLDRISSAKSRELTAAQWLNELNAAKSSQQASQQMSKEAATEAAYNRAIASVYFAYERALKACSGLDLDDLLLKGCALLRVPGVLDNIVHVLVDEFQDTNTIQYTIMSLFARATTGNLARSPGLLAPDWQQDGPAPVGLSIVGDPDQSIYGWRNAEVTNLVKMCDEFEGTCSVNLEENYRSTGAVLEASLKIVEQDENRIAKGLFTSHPQGLPVVLTSHMKPDDEAKWIASEIKRLIAYSGGVLNCDDFAILLRYNALSREIERALQAESLPCRMMGGSKFFDRTEIKDILAYLTLAENPHFTSAFMRVINVPKRNIGEKTIEILEAEAREQGISVMMLTEKIIAGGKTAVRPNVKNALSDFVKMVAKARSLAKKHSPVSDIIEHILKSGYQEHLKKDRDSDSRVENVKELIAFSKTVVEQGLEAVKPGEQGNSDSDEFGSDDEDIDMEEYAKIEEEVICSQSQILASSQSQSQSFPVKDEHFDDEDEDVKPQKSGSRGTKRALEQDAAKSGKVSRARLSSSSAGSKVDPIGLDDEDEEEEDKSQVKLKDEPALDHEALQLEADVPQTPLRRFMAACVLSSDLTEDKGEEVPRVTIATCHAAKGLEFGVTFVCSVTGGVFPFFKCVEDHEIAEERRLLYVACTRAQTLLYLTWSSERTTWKGPQQTFLSPFVAPLADKISFRGGTYVGSSHLVPSAIDLRPRVELAGGFEIKGAPKGPSKPKIKKQVEPIPFSNERPAIGRLQIEEIARILERKLPDDFETKLKSDIAGFEKSETAKRILADVDQSAQAAMAPYLGDDFDENVYGGNRAYSQPLRTSMGTSFQPGGASRFGGAASQQVGSSSWASLKPEISPQKGFTKASSLVRGGTTKAFSTPMPAPKREIKPAPSFTDQYRLGSQNASGKAVVVDGEGSPQKPIDLERFESTAKSNLQDFKNLLPADLPAPIASASAAKAKPAAKGKGKKAAPAATPSISRAAALGLTRKPEPIRKGWRSRR